MTNKNKIMKNLLRNNNKDKEENWKEIKLVFKNRAKVNKGMIPNKKNKKIIKLKKIWIMVNNLRIMEKMKYSNQIKTTYILLVMNF